MPDSGRNREQKIESVRAVADALNLNTFQALLAEIDSLRKVADAARAMARAWERGDGERAAMGDLMRALEEED